MLRPDKFCVNHQSDGSINADFPIRSVNNFCRYIKKSTVSALDNAPTHRSQKFIAQMEKWMRNPVIADF